MPNYVFPTSYTENSTIRIYRQESWEGNGRAENATISSIMTKVAAKGFNAFFLTERYNNGYNYAYVFPFNISSLVDTIYCIDKDNPQISYQRAGIDQPISTARYQIANNEIWQQGTENYVTQTINGKTYNERTNDAAPDPTILVIMNYDGTCYLNEQNVTPIVYSWKPFDTLKGKQYTIPLTMINKDKIGDYETPTITTLRSDFDRISEAASLLPIFQNTPVGQMVTIAYSGDNWATMQAQRNPEPDTNDFLLDIKFRMALTQSIIYTYTARLQLDTYLQYPYLSFIVDDENEAAVFDCVTYYESSVSLQEPHWGYLGRSQTEAEMHALWLWLQPSKNAEEPDNPYEDGTDDNGGEGGNPTPQTHLPLPSLPSEGGLDLGLFTVYNFDSTNKSMLNSIAAFLWSDAVLDNFKKYFNNFSDNILALYILPYTPGTLPTKAFKVGRVTSDTITAAPYLTSRFVDIDMGSIKVKPRWTSYIDYSPYTKFEIYLPGIGIESLDADDIMSPANSDGELVDQQGSVISLNYRLDLCTGFIVAYVFINDEMRYQYSGKVGMNVPITGENYNAMIQAFITGGSLVAGTLVKGGLSAPLTASLANGAASAVAGTVNAQKPDVYRSGNMGGDASMMACPNPYLIRHVPNKPQIDEQEVFTGFPSYKTGTLSEFDGYTECIEAHVEGISCTETERDMIIDLLKNGVIL